MNVWKLHFVCTGNLCRSPMAEFLARHLASDYGVQVQATSSGTHGMVGREAPPLTIAVLEERGFDASSHRVQVLSEAMLNESDLILVAAPEHATMAREMLPSAELRIALIGAPIGLMTMPDPWGGTLQDYRQCRDRIEKSLRSWFTRLPKEPIRRP